MIVFDITTNILLRDLLFVAIATAFLAIAGRAWQGAKAYELPKPLPQWFTLWFTSVQILGVFPPLLALVWWGIGQHYSGVLVVFLSYFIILALQIISERLTLRRFRSVTWVMVPYLYVPYRLWQLYEGLGFIEPGSNLVWVRAILMLELVVWSVNYGLDLAQLPRLYRWESGKKPDSINDD
ncbi:hypothetical protein IQ268_18680 [Oculatella sp. LEGE 06141]|uniref:hypothetical protein n=1 Tax=Oculatella sp. LEGE 06141 TaxID=1828648 RepID=UPI00187FE41F|nr:hypothetical protein [Oculatella sp. LEGE 06141]MBE9180591.1 hypothetical protein [Oculatella sp. LEGE 06141]